MSVGRANDADFIGHPLRENAAVRPAIDLNPIPPRRPRSITAGNPYIDRGTVKPSIRRGLKWFPIS
jgi:hypothetical protein